MLPAPDHDPIRTAGMRLERRLGALPAAQQLRIGEDGKTTSGWRVDVHLVLDRRLGSAVAATGSPPFSPP